MTRLISHRAAIAGTAFMAAAVPGPACGLDPRGDGKRRVLARFPNGDSSGPDPVDLIPDDMLDPLPGPNGFRVRPESPALKAGFKNFEMGLWGITKDFPAAWRDE